MPTKPTSKPLVVVALLAVAGGIVVQFDLCARGSGSSPVPSVLDVQKVPEEVMAQARAAAAAASAEAQAVAAAALVGEREREPESPTPALPGSRAVFRGHFASLGIAVRPSSAVNGVPREMGASANNHMTVETMGHGDRLEKATLVFGVQSGDSGSVALATASITVFMRETGWEGGLPWVVAEMKKGKGAKRTKNGAAYELSIPLPGMFVLSAKPAVL